MSSEAYRRVHDVSGYLLQFIYDIYLAGSCFFRPTVTSLRYIVAVRLSPPDTVSTHSHRGLYVLGRSLTNDQYCTFNRRRQWVADVTVAINTGSHGAYRSPMQWLQSQSGHYTASIFTPYSRTELRHRHRSNGEWWWLSIVVFISLRKR